jgi:hypothetical protein
MPPLGAAIAGAGSAIGSAAAATAPFLIAGSTALSVIQTRQQAKQQAAIAKFNEQVAEQQAKAREQAGKIRLEERQKRTRALLEEQRAAFGATGVRGGTGSPLLLRLKTAEQGALDALTEQFNTQIGVNESLNQAELFRTERSAARARGRLGVGASIFGGATQLASFQAQREKKVKGAA